MNNHTIEFNNFEESSHNYYLLHLDSNFSQNNIKFSLNKGENIIGRSDGVEIFLDDVTVSRKHCSIVINENNLFIEDFDSTNGIYLNHNLITKKEILKSGDKIQIGKYLFILINGSI